MMDDLLDFLKTIISAPGLPGHEGPVRRLVEDAWRPLSDELRVSRLGSLHALRRGTGAEPRPRLLLAAHLDAIGMLVTGVLDGFLRLSDMGGLDPRVLPGQLVTVHARRDLPGILVQPPSHLLPEQHRDGMVPLEYLLVDVALPPEEVERLVRTGDLVSFAQQPFEMGGELLAGHSLDNRASVAAVTACLQELQGRKHVWDIWAVATVQEEETLGGAATSSFELRPDLAVAIDVTYASGPGSPDHLTFPLGKGITLGWGPNIHPLLYRRFQEIAERLEIPYRLEAMPRHSGTDAYSLQVAAEGVPTMVVSIPLRYMHTPVEVISMQDVLRAGRVLAEFAASLQADFMETQPWSE